MRIAVEGCCHGELDAIYASIKQREEQNNYKVDLLLICGDFQAMRNEADLETMACPRKYLQLGTFHKYYSGERKVPIPTIFIGGNHEASNYLWELYHGGWVCPGIYFLGFGGVIRVGDLRIGGMSGIYKDMHYDRGHYELSPYSDNHKRSVYHIRKYDVYKMLQVNEAMDVFISHDWPLGIEQYGDTAGLLRIKPYFKAEVQSNRLGSPAFEQVLRKVRPANWYSAHLHVRFTARVDWGPSPTLAQQHSEKQVGSNTSTASTKPGAEAPLDLSLMPSASLVTNVPAEPNVNLKNPDEIEISFEDDDDDTGDKPEQAATTVASEMPLRMEALKVETPTATSSGNPDEIQIDFDDFEEDNSDQGGSGDNSNAETPKSVNAEDKENESLATLPLLEQQQQPNQTIDPNIPQPRPRLTYTNFLALDKCLPKRRFLEIIDFPEATSPAVFRYDEEWLSIVRTLDPFLSTDFNQSRPTEGEALKHALETNREWVRNNITLKDGLDIPYNFQKTAPAHDPVRTMNNKEKQDFIMPYLNPQTAEFCAMLQIPNKINPFGRQ